MSPGTNPSAGDLSFALNLFRRAKVIFDQDDSTSDFDAVAASL